MLRKWLYKMLKEDLFISLRVYAGGAHMNSLWKCGICSLAIIIVVGLAFKYDVGGGYIDICLGLLCCGTIQLRWENQDGRRQTSFVYLNQ